MYTVCFDLYPSWLSHYNRLTPCPLFFLFCFVFAAVVFKTGSHYGPLAVLASLFRLGWTQIYSDLLAYASQVLD